MGRRVDGSQGEELRGEEGGETLVDMKINEKVLIKR